MAGLSKLTDSLIKSDDSGVQGVADDDCFMGDAVEGDAMNEHRLLVLVRKFNENQWVTAGVVTRKSRTVRCESHYERRADVCANQMERTR